MKNDKSFTKEEALAYLQRERNYLDLSAIGREIGIGRRLSDILNGKKGGTGYPATLADKYVPSLIEWMKKHTSL